MKEYNKRNWTVFLIKTNFRKNLSFVCKQGRKRKSESKGLPPKDDVCRLQMMVKPVEEAVIVSGGQTQQQIDVKLNKLVDKYPEVFSGIGRVKLDPIHIHRKEGGRSPVAQKLRPVALHLMEPLRKHLDELVQGGVIEGPLGSEYATGWVSNMVIEAKIEYIIWVILDNYIS